MWIVIVAVAVLVLVAAAYAGLGHLGEMPQDPVTDRPRGRVPDGPIDPELLAELRLPLAGTGYATDEVDAYLDRLVAGEAVPPAEARFSVVRRGYDMQIVDDLLDRPMERAEEPLDAAPDGPGFGPTARPGLADKE